MLELLRAMLGPRTDVPVPDATDTGAMVAAFAAASRRVGKQPLVVALEEEARLRAAGVDWPLAARVDELWRITLLMAAAPRRDIERLIVDAYRHGDTDERCAVLRALPLLPEPGRFAALAADACRTSVRPIFAAIARQNPYPARHLGELHFNQMVLKALFLDEPLAAIIGLEARRTPELTRMAADYARERRAAGRPVSADTARLASWRSR